MKDEDLTDASEAAMAAKSGDPYPNYVDLDSEVQVQSGINVSEDQDEVLRAATCFMKSPNRALSARELGILMAVDDDIVDTYGYIDELVYAGFIHEVNELDGEYKRYRVV